MKYAINVISFPIFYSLQAVMLNLFFGWKIASIYWWLSFLLVFLYTKLSITNTEN
jgi:1-acyl-sn-glycerol-3-phosphate acyltransferase